MLAEQVMDGRREGGPGSVGRNFPVVQSSSELLTPVR